MAKKIDEKLLQKERDSLEQDLIAARANVERSKNQVQAILGAIQMTDRLIALSKEGNYSKSRANSEQEIQRRQLKCKNHLKNMPKTWYMNLGMMI